MGNQVGEPDEVLQNPVKRGVIRGFPFLVPDMRPGVFENLLVVVLGGRTEQQVQNHAHQKGHDPFRRFQIKALSGGHKRPKKTP